MLSRAQWKKMRSVGVGIPKGERFLCKCGALLVVDMGAEEFIVHHAEPHCSDYEKVVEKAEFLTLTAASAEEVEQAVTVARSEQDERS